MKKTIVIALGGNALLRSNQKGTVEEQEENIKTTMKNFVSLIKNKDCKIVITHGNGPQVGNIVLRSDAGESLYSTPQVPLDICIADSQGKIAYMIERILRNILKENNIDKEVASLITQIAVNKNDKAFNNPSKRIGRFYTEEEAKKNEKEKNWKFLKEVKIDKTGYRRVVPSPKPIEIINLKSIKRNLDADAIVIATGGGGIPVFIDEEKNIKPIEQAVIDKDLSSSLLANLLDADELYILTDVPFVYENFGKTEQKEIKEMTVKQAKKWLSSGAFGKGNMKPKIEAAIGFIKNEKQKCIITDSNNLGNENKGTRIVF